MSGCRTRHVTPRLAGLLAGLAGALGGRVDPQVLEAVLLQARRVYSMLRRLPCRDRRVREAAQLLYEAATLGAAGPASAALAAMLAAALLALNGERLPDPDRLASAAAAACLGGLDVEGVEEALSRGVVEPPRPPRGEGRVAAWVASEYLGAPRLALLAAACGGRSGGRGGQGDTEARPQDRGARGG